MACRVRCCTICCTTRVILLNVNVKDIPHIPDAERIRVQVLPQGFWQVIIDYGFKDEPDIPAALEHLDEPGMEPVEMMETSFFLGRETIVPNVMPTMPLWQQILFTWMFRNADSATAYFKTPATRLVELGTQIEL